MSGVNQSISGVLSIDEKIITQLEKAQDRLRKLNSEANSLEKSFGRAKDAALGMAKAVNGIKLPKGTINLGIGDANRKLANINRMLGKMDFQKPFSAASKSVQELSDRLNTVKQTTQDIRDLAKQLGAAFNGGSGGMDNAGNAADRNRDKFRQFNRELASIKRDSKELYDILMGLGAIKALGNMLKSAVAVRGEFEMAQRSLGFIIGDIAKSEEIFSKIKEQAVVSPFEVGDLVKQTRQLAAYGIETEKLAETTKRLGDIASGVGVDMGRLILAYGQVKAAQFLRLTEVRQFTEAGVDVLGGLAQYFSEVEKRAVSVGEVMTRITKKMVTFSDVEVVLNRLTSAGGKFYMMQEKQADTIQGTISNLKDRLNIELNDMMSAYDGVIKGVLNVTQNLLKGLSVIAPAIAAAFSGAAVAGAVFGMGKIINAVKVLITVLSGARGALSAWSGWLGILTMLGSVAVMTYTQLSKLSRELKQINQDAEIEAGNLESKYRRLTDEIKNAADGSELQRKAMEKLRAEFGNILPAIDMEAEAIGNLTNKYDQHIQAIRNYTIEKANQQRTEKLINRMNEDASDSMKFFTFSGTYSGIRDKLQEMAGIGADEAREIVESSINVIIQELLDKKISADLGTLSRRIAELINNYVGSEVLYDFDILNSGLNSLMQNLIKNIKKFSSVGSPNIDLGVTRDQQELNGVLRNFSSMMSGIRTALKDSGLFKDNSEQLDLAMDSVLSVYRKLLQAKALNPDLDLAPFMDSLNAAISTAKGSMDEKKLGDATSKAFKDAVGKIDWGKSLESAASGLDEAWWKSVTAALSSKREHTSIEDVMFQRIDGVLGSKNLTSIKRRLTEIIADINKDFSLPTIKLPTIQDRQGLSDYAQTVYTELKKSKDSLKNLASGAGDKELKNLEYLSRFGGDTNKLKDYISAMERLWAALSPFYTPPETKGGKSSGKQPKDYLRELAEAVAEFPSKSVDKIDAEVRHLKDSMVGLAKGAGIQFAPDSVLSSEKSIIEWLNSVRDRLEKGKSDALQFKVAITFDKFEIKELKRQANNLFTNYQSSLGFEKNGLSIPGMESSNIMQQIVEIENKLREVYGDNTEAANIETRRLTIIKKNQEDIINLIAKKQVDVTKKAVGIIESATREMSSMAGVNKNSGITGISVSDSHKSLALLNTMKEMLSKVGHEQYDILRSSELYVDSFNDLGNVSYAALTSLKEMLEQVKGSFGLTPRDERMIEKQILKIETRLGEMNGDKRTYLFSGIVKQYKDINSELKNLGGAKDDYVNAINERTAAQIALNEVTEKYRELQGVGEGGELSAEQEAELLQMKDYKDAVERVAKATDKANKATETYMGTINRIRNAQKLLKAQISKLQSTFSEMTDLISGTIELCEGLAEGFGITFGDEHTEAVQAFLKGFELMSKGLTLVAGGVTVVNLLMDVLNIKADELMIKLWPLALVAAALGATFAAIKIVDNKRKKQIEENLKLVEALTDRYDKLSEAMDAAGSVSTLTQHFKEANQVLMEQIAALEEARRIEEKRGVKKDEEEVEDINKKMIEAYEKQKELRKKFYEDLGAPTEWSKEADEWASAWLSAFKKGESGIESLRESMDDMLDEIIAKQLKLRVLAPLLSDLENAVKDALSDGVISKDELAYINAIKEKSSQLANVYMEQMLDKLGYEASKTQSESDLSRSIQNITESTADALEAILNSSRYYSADTNRKVGELLLLLSDADGARNPVLSELRAQTSILRDIYRVLNDNTKPGGHKLGGSGFKTFATVS